MEEQGQGTSSSPPNNEDGGGGKNVNVTNEDKEVAILMSSEGENVVEMKGPEEEVEEEDNIMEITDDDDVLDGGGGGKEGGEDLLLLQPTDEKLPDEEEFEASEKQAEEEAQKNKEEVKEEGEEELSDLGEGENVGGQVPSTATSSVDGDKEANPVGNLNKLLACTKSLSHALAKPVTTIEGLVTPTTSSSSVTKPSDSQQTAQKRKIPGGCCNPKCSSSSGPEEMVVAKREALLYYQFNTSYKKVHKICGKCNAAAEVWFKNSVNALATNENMFAFKPSPVGGGGGEDGDVIEVSEGEEEDNPNDLKLLEEEGKQTVLVDMENLDNILAGIMDKIDLKSQLEKCEAVAEKESENLEQEFAAFEKDIQWVERQVGDLKKLYDEVAGHYQPIPIVMDVIEIAANGKTTRSPAVNEHLKNYKGVDLDKLNLSPAARATIPANDSSPIAGGEYTSRPRKAKENRTYRTDDNDEIMEVDEPTAGKSAQTCPLVKAPKDLPRIIPEKGNVVYAQHKTLLHFWLKAEVTDVVDMGPGKAQEYIVRFEKKNKLASNSTAGTRQQQKQVTAKQMAYNLHCPFILTVGTRVIAKFKDEFGTDPVGDNQYYAGIVAEFPSPNNGYRYLVFFDDGYAQYTHHKNVLLVYEFAKEVWTDVHPDSAEFIRQYVSKYPERPMVRLTPGTIVTTEWHGKWWVARVMEVDCSLVKMQFQSDGRLEWIYRGSTRLSPLYERQTKLKQKKNARRSTSAPLHRNRNGPSIEFNYVDDENSQEKSNDSAKEKPTARKSTAKVNQAVDRQYADIRRMARLDYGEFEGTIIKRTVPPEAPQTKEYAPHDCGPSCVHCLDENKPEFKKISPLAIPLHLGFSREIAKTPRRSVFYRGPCGLRIRDIEEMYDYLKATECNIQIDHFCFDLAVDCLNEFRHSRQHSFLPDLTYGKENRAVQVVNAFDYEYPPYVEYSRDRIAGAGVHLNTDEEFLVGCDCEDDCRDPTKCSCWQMTKSGISFTKLQNQDYPVKGYENRRLKDHISSGIYECNKLCKCSKTCCNRVVQNGLKVPLQVFKTAAKGWGIRPLFDVPEGSFICIYAGQVLTDAGANEDGKQFGDEYLAELDFLDSIERIKEDYESDCTDIEAEEPGTRSKQRQQGQSDENKHRGLKSTSSGKNGGNKQDSDSDDDNGGARPRSTFNVENNVESLKRKKKIERKPLREYFGEDEECYIMDAKTMGNIGRYLNHSCQPNVFVQNVFVDTHDLRFPWVSFFASKHIRAGSELTWDYNYEIGSVPNKVLYCYCGSPDCRGRLL